MTFRDILTRSGIGGLHIYELSPPRSLVLESFMSHRSPLAFLSTCLLSAFFVMGCEPPPAEWLTELSCADGELAFVTEEMDGLIEETECQPIPATCPADGAEDWLDDLPADCVEDLCGTDSPGTMQTGIYTQPDTDDEYVVFGCTP